MPITKEEAIHILDLEHDIDPDAIAQAISQKQAQIQQRIDSAPTDALREKYRRQLLELDEAAQLFLGGGVLSVTSDGTGGTLSQTMIHDLPLSGPSYTRVDQAHGTPNAGALLKIGQTLGSDQRYRIEEQIGSGGMGVVYRAFDKNRDKDIAIKVLLPAFLSHAKAKDRFLKEARLSSEMSHPHIVTVFDVQQEAGHTFLTMELLQGKSLRAYLDTLKQMRKPVALDDALRYIEHICQGLSYAHGKGAVHRDIKPENIWLTEDGQAKVMDFGIARLMSNTQITNTGVGIGTAYYMSPEQLQGLAEIDGRADQYATAIVLYEMLYGAIPTGRIESLRKLDKKIPKCVSNAVDKALAPKREYRFPDIQAFSKHLRGQGVAGLYGLLKIFAIVLSIIIVLGGLTMSLPTLKKLMPDKEAERNQKQEVARLEGEVEALQKRVDERRRESDTNLQSTKREVERLTNQLTSARSDTDKQKLENTLWEAKTKQASSEFIMQGLNNILESNDGLMRHEGNLRAAEAAQKNNQWADAKALLEQTQVAFLKINEVPGQLLNQWNAQRTTWLQPINGKWAFKDCTSAPTFSVKDPILSVIWPQHGTFEEKVLDVSGEGKFITTVLSPEKYRGRLYRYQLTGDTLELTEINSGRSNSIKRCN
jgi:serine/threonine protein kinase